ncbi:uncharacterized protein LOC107844302 [Capsicum annuum]|uniref:uncharacterized protein LOC107844302 n=1 Tax=Capsicum annuum TaxID=4072 RepID=UPI001FB09266|nr:uncharacterized protein LOC107844302 [Capsicum annuum]
MDISQLVIYMQQVEKEKKKQDEIEEKQSKKFCYSNQGGGQQQSEKCWSQGNVPSLMLVKEGRNKCSQVHCSISEEGRNKCFRCSQIGHMQRDCPFRVASGENKIPITDALVSAPKGVTSASGSITGQNCLYALTSHQEFEASPDVVTVLTF